MSIDSATAADTVADNQATADPVVADSPAPQVDSQPAAGDAEGVIAEDGSINVDSQTSDQGSSTTLDTTSQTPNQAAPVRNWEAELAASQKRIADLQAGHSRAKNELHQIRQTYQGVDPAAVAQWRRAQQESQQKNLPVWNAKNPAHQTFQQDLARWKGYKEAYQRAATPEQKQVLKDTMGSIFTPESQARIQEWENHQASFSERMAMDPAGTIDDIVEQKFQERMQQHELQVEARTEVSGWFQDPANAPLIQKYAQPMQKALAEGVPWPYVRQMAIDRAKIESSQSREGEVNKTVAQARAQQSALRQKVTITRDGKTAPHKDVAAEVSRIMKEKGWRMTDPRVLELTNQLSKQT